MFQLAEATLNHPGGIVGGYSPEDCSTPPLCTGLMKRAREPVRLRYRTFQFPCEIENCMIVLRDCPSGLQYSGRQVGGGWAAPYVRTKKSRNRSSLAESVKCGRIAIAMQCARIALNRPANKEKKGAALRSPGLAL